MGYYDKERVRGFLHNQDGIIVNDFGEEVILRGWGMGNWDNPEGFMLGTPGGKSHSGQRHDDRRDRRRTDFRWPLTGSGASKNETSPESSVES